MKHFYWKDRFTSVAPTLRREFEARFEDPLEADSKRFVWDYWHVPGQYTLMRTPAYHFFSKQVYKKFHQALLSYGREVLGCWDVTPPWLSYYVDGCEQKLHADVPHGPWAFVFSLTPWKKRKFSGGETLIFKPSTLQYWSSLREFNGVEEKDLLDSIAPQFNRLTVFDPRFPHGVREVRGTKDPREGRLVIHGWFTEPRPFLEGALSRKAATSALDEGLQRMQAIWAECPEIHGTMSVRLQISPSGHVRAAKALTQTVIALDEPTFEHKEFEKLVVFALRTLRFPKAKGPSSLTVPLLFR